MHTPKQIVERKVASYCQRSTNPVETQIYECQIEFLKILLPRKLTPKRKSEGLEFIRNQVLNNQTNGKI